MDSIDPFSHANNTVIDTVHEHAEIQTTLRNRHENTTRCSITLRLQDPPKLQSMTDLMRVLRNDPCITHFELVLIPRQVVIPYTTTESTSDHLSNEDVMEYILNGLNTPMTSVHTIRIHMTPPINHANDMLYSKPKLFDLLLKVLKENKQLRGLHLFTTTGFMKMNAPGAEIERLSHIFKHTAVTDLRFQTRTIDVLKFVAQEMASNQQIRLLEITPLRYDRDANGVRDGEKTFTAKHIELFLPSLWYNTTLRKLHIKHRSRYPEDTDVQVAALVQLLTHNRTISYIGGITASYLLYTEDHMRQLCTTIEDHPRPFPLKLMVGDTRLSPTLAAEFDLPLVFARCDLENMIAAIQERYIYNTSRMEAFAMGQLRRLGYETSWVYGLDAETIRVILGYQTG
jgi:hypothetical protein